MTAALGDLGISNVGIVRVTRSDIDSLKEQVRLDAIHSRPKRWPGRSGRRSENVSISTIRITTWLRSITTI